MFDADDQKRLLAIARRSLDARVRRAPAPAVDSGGALDVPRGAFVSIHRHRQLRGCLGRIESDLAVCRVVAHLARAVTDSDPRFQPVTVDEIDHLHIEISVLTPERHVRTLGEIEIGRHGLIVERGHRRGLLLPQVAVEHRWDAHTFVQQTAVKAGLAPDAWRSGANVFAFEAQVFAERP
jgi:AmmeMemoRadiSam system protein A